MRTSIPSNWPLESLWTDFLAEAFETESFQTLTAFLENARRSKTVFPPHEHVFEAFRWKSPIEVKVVLLGQDPYHGDDQAHGLAFSVPENQKLPPSLKNIFKELKADLDIENRNGDLTAWARQGVLLLNTVLTVEKSNAHSHRGKGWEIFTDYVIQKIGQRKDPIVFLLWGNPAIKKNALIQKHHKVITSTHPSPLSAYRGFFGSHPFSKVNSALQSLGKTPIDWTT
ncbi:MAG: uracil-DNA glycosylase [Planctomycetota bacterium]